VRRNGAALLAALAIGIASQASQSEGGALACPAAVETPDQAVRQAYEDLRRGLPSSPLVRRLGPAASCSATVEDGSVRIEIAAGRARLEVRHDPSIEFAEQRFSATGLSRNSGIVLLQRTERWAFGKGGCGIDWKKAPEIEIDPVTGVRESVYRGEACNCQGRLLYSRNRVTGLVFRSAC